jgi:hypothetical protein
VGRALRASASYTLWRLLRDPAQRRTVLDALGPNVDLA